MKKINRAQLRGRPLDPLCRKARTTTHEYGPKDNRVYCFGVYDCMSEELSPTCAGCKAYVENSEPPKEG